MAGWTTDGVQTIAPITVNGTLTSITAMVNNGTVVTEGAAPVLTQLPSGALVSADVQNPAGSQPLTAAASAFQIAAHAAGLISNTGSSTAGTATLNTVSGLITTESLSTAVGATYSFAIVNSLVTATSPAPSVAFLRGTDTAGEAQINSITNTAGTATVVIQNTGTAAWSGKWLLAFHV